MKRKFILLMLAMLPLVAFPEGINETEARQKAETFLMQRGRHDVRLQQVSLTSGPRRSAAHQASNPYYVFNTTGAKGFVIVSGDDRTPDILGYADSGTISEDNMPDGLRYLLDGYAEQLEWLDEHPAEVRSANRASTSRHAIAPLVKTNWNQGEPYNAYCPTLTDGKQTVTGCVATTMAQLMYYHKCPTGETTSIPGYTTRNKLFTLDGLDATTFDWNDMLTTYGSGATDTQKAAVAKLMQYCGWALQMNYNTTSSAYSQSIAEGLKLYFGYSSGIDFVRRNAYSYTDWIDLLYSELANQRPIALGGQSAGGGHSFVCDGYQGDDYFHINWGWGGDSDGYFRLSALDPYEQGIGGSSTLDGFSYDQEAVIGIQPAKAGEAPAVTWLVLEGMQFDDQGTASKTFTRSSSDADFTDIPLYFIVDCMTPGTTTFEMAAQVKDTDGNVKQIIDIESDPLAFSKTYSVTKKIGLGSNLGDGTYLIYLVNRVSGATGWQPCYGSGVHHLTAVIADNTLTLTSPRVVRGDNPTLVSITTDPTSPTLGEEVNVIATVKGGNSDYYGDLLLYVNGSKVMGKQADVPAGETVSVRFTYTPSTPGNNTLAVYAGNTEFRASTQIGESTITVIDDGSTMALTLGLAATISNTYTDGGTTYYYGNGIRATITVTNNSTEYTYKGQVNCSIRTWDGDSYTGDVTSYAVTVPKATDSEHPGTYNIPIVIDGLKAGGTYNLRITYYTVTDGKKKLASNELQTDKLVMGEGYALGDATGSMSCMSLYNSDPVDCGSACFVDLTGISDLSSLSVTPSTNSNCLYLLAAGATAPADLDGKNVIKGSTAESITLVDGSDFYSPIDFTAENISYTRTFSVPATGSAGWNTLLLPFTVSKVTIDDGSANGKTVDWFHSASDTGKNFWLKTFTGDDAGTVYFDYADKLTANTPYIIAVPGDTWGPDWQMTEKPVTFSATDAAVSATKTATLSGNSYKFCGSTVGQTLSSGYALNEKGSRFVNVANLSSKAVAPFRTWIEAANVSSLSRSALDISSGLPNAITPTTHEPITVNQYYDLQGSRVNHAHPSAGGDLQSPTLVEGICNPRPTIIITNGKKHILKRR